MMTMTGTRTHGQHTLQIRSYRQKIVAHGGRRFDPLLFVVILRVPTIPRVLILFTLDFARFHCVSPLRDHCFSGDNNRSGDRGRPSIEIS